MEVQYLDKLFGKNLYIEPCTLGEMMRCRNFMNEVFNYQTDQEIQKAKKSGDPNCDYDEMLSCGWNKDNIPYVIWPQKLIGHVIDSIKYRRTVDINVKIKDGKMKFESFTRG